MERGTVGNTVLGEFLAYNFINLKSFENHLLGYFFKEQVFSITPKSHPQTLCLYHQQGTFFRKHHSHHHHYYHTNQNTLMSINTNLPPRFCIQTTHSSFYNHTSIILILPSSIFPLYCRNSNNRDSGKHSHYTYNNCWKKWPSDGCFENMH